MHQKHCSCLSALIFVCSKIGAEVDKVDKKDCTALHIAALYGHDLLTGTLLAVGADPRKPGYQGILLT